MKFEDAARKYLGVTTEHDYYYEEYEAGLDHFDVDSLSEFAEYFYKAGQESAKKE